MPLRTVPLSSLRIRDERALSTIPLYSVLKELLASEQYRFRVPTRGSPLGRWSSALFLNLAYWNAGEAADILEDASIEADVLCHAGWHLAAQKALQSTSPRCLFLGESVASAFDLYLVGALLRAAPRSSFLKSQLPAMQQVFGNAGGSPGEFAQLLEGVAESPEQAFSDLRAMLFDTGCGLLAAGGVDEGAEVLEKAATHRFGALLHHYEMAVWLLYAKAYGKGEDPAELALVDRGLREEKEPVAWLSSRWLPRANP